MGIFNVNELQAQNYAQEQTAHALWSYIVAAIKEFPSAAQQMNLSMGKITIFPPGVKRPSPRKETKKACYFLAFAHRVDADGNLARLFNRIVISPDGFGCVARTGFEVTYWRDIPAEELATLLIQHCVEFTNIASARQVFESALKGIPLKISLYRMFPFSC